MQPPEGSSAQGHTSVPSNSRPDPILHSQAWQQALKHANREVNGNTIAIERTTESPPSPQCSMLQAARIVANDLMRNEAQAQGTLQMTVKPEEELALMLLRTNDLPTATSEQQSRSATQLIQSLALQALAQRQQEKKLVLEIEKLSQTLHGIQKEQTARTMCMSVLIQFESQASAARRQRQDNVDAVIRAVFEASQDSNRPQAVQDALQLSTQYVTLKRDEPTAKDEVPCFGSDASSLLALAEASDTLKRKYAGQHTARQQPSTLQ